MGASQAAYQQDAHYRADILNDRVLPFFAKQLMGLIRILPDRVTEYFGKLEAHD